MYNRVTLFGIMFWVTVIAGVYHLGNLQFHAYPENSSVRTLVTLLCLSSLTITFMLGVDLYLSPTTKEITDRYGNILTFERGWHTLWFWHMVDCRRPDGTLVYARIR